MRKFLIASHGKFAAGLLDSIKMIVGEMDNLQILCAYDEDSLKGIDEEVRVTMEYIKDTDELIIMTDLLGGSVNAEFLKWLGRKNIYLVTGVNAALVLEILLGEKIETNELIRRSIRRSREGIVFLNDMYKENN